MIRRKSLIIALMLNGGGLHAMMCVQTKDMPVMLPKAFIEASSVLKNIETTQELKPLKTRALFEDYTSAVVLRVIQDQAELVSKQPLESGRMVGYRDLGDMPLYISLAKRLELTALISEYAKIVQISRN